MSALLIAAAAAAFPGALPLDRSWAALARDRAAGDRTAFAADRRRVVALTTAVLATWQVGPDRTLPAGAGRIILFNGPARVRGERSRSPFFALTIVDGAFRPPVFWELTPGFSPPGLTYWFLSASSCDLRTGASLVGHPRLWTAARGAPPPSQARIVTAIRALHGWRQAFGADTTISKTVGAACFQVGGLTDQPVPEAR